MILNETAVQTFSRDSTSDGRKRPSTRNVLFEVIRDSSRYLNFTKRARKSITCIMGKYKWIKIRALIKYPDTYCLNTRDSNFFPSFN